MRSRPGGKLLTTKKKTGGAAMMEGRGFTLVELLVGLAVAAILLAMAIPGYAFLANASRLATTTNDLMTAVHLARSEAVKRGMRVTVCKSGGSATACNGAADWQQGWIVFVDGGTRGAVDAGDVVLWVRDGGSPYATIASTNYNRYISYLSNGRSQGSNGLANGRFEICVQGSQRDIVVNRVGRPWLDAKTC